MAEKIVSPGVFTKEIDASFLPAAIGEIGGVVVGPTVKGPAGVPTVVESYSEFQAKFGDVFKSGSGYYQYLTSQAAKNYLNNAGRMTVVRILPTDCGAASSDVSDSLTDVPATAVNAIDTAGYVASSGDASFTISIPTSAGGLGGTAVTILLDENEIDPGAGAADTIKIGTYAGAETDALAAGYIVDAINGVADAEDRIEFASTGNGEAGDDLGITAAITDGETTKITLTMDTAGPAGNIAGALASTSGIDIIDVTAFTGDIGGGLGDISFKIHTHAHGTILNSGGGSEGENNVLSNGTSNNLRWEVPNKNDAKGTFTLLVRRGDDTSKRKQILETWNNLSLDPNASNYISKVIGDSVATVQANDGDPYLDWTGEWPNKSNYIRVEPILNTVDYLDENGNIRVNDASGSLPAIGSGSFTGGSDGTGLVHPAAFNENISDSNNLQGFNLGETKVSDAYTIALNLLANQDEYDFNLLLLPGIIRNQPNHTAIVTKAIDICESRGDAFTIIDSVDYGTNSITAVNSEAKLMNSNYAATYWPWCQVNDAQTGKNVWVPPSVVLGGVYSYNDKVAQPWFAPAGLSRGLTTAIQAKRKLTHSNRDDLYESNVNPLATFPGQGVVVWGQKTLQKKASALDRVNVRRLLIKCKKFIASSSRFLVFEQNNSATRQRFLNIANPFLEQVQAQSGLNAFKVIMNDSNNTPDMVDRNILYGQLFLQPTKTAEFIVLDFTIQPTGAAFPE